jgi:hypothetical protein
MNRTRSDLRTIILCFESESNEITGDVCTGQISAVANSVPHLDLRDLHLSVTMSYMQETLFTIAKICRSIFIHPQLFKRQAGKNE